MADPITLVALTAFIVKNASSWLTSLSGTILDKGREAVIDKGKEVAVAQGERFVRGIFHLDEREQLRHLEQALKNATERGLATFDTLQERDLYKDILRTLSQPGPQGKALRREIMQLFTLSETPDLAALTDLYNQRQRFYNAASQDIDAAPYLNSFFTALIGELYADAYFRPQLSDVLQRHAANSMQQSLLDIVDVLKRIGETLEENYSAEDFARDVAGYATYIEGTLHHLKMVGVVPKDQNADPELSGIFVPLRIALNERTVSADQQPDTIIAALEQFPCLVLLGGPGSGKSTATKHLAWSHAANQSTLALADMRLLSGNPLPLRIELRRLSEERKRANYDFLSFVTEVLLKRDGIDINPQMFEELLTRRCMLLLFDGLDEVATLDERLELVGEIEHFALSYPGNRVLVTSRPVGYDLARISHPLFSHAEVQNFNDEQIQQFLANWYTAVLRLSPIPQREREELDLLLATLKENPRLHKLAENPLLLTVITALHRYERLPDRRVLVYDRCADLLLETWAKLKGTNTRWREMKLIKEDQYACIAHLGFILHKRSHSQDGGTGPAITEQWSYSSASNNQTSDVPTTFLLKAIERFFQEQNLFPSVAQQRAEAHYFLELMQMEAGLIIEQGTDETGQMLYGFVHRTFQEYFAAIDVYERYQQEENATIISQFLEEYLHDLHWREVTLLLLGKLKRKPVTVQLQNLLNGKIKSRLSRYTDVIQHDLFFICSCLAEEIIVEQELAMLVASRVSDLVKTSPFPSQRNEALDALVALIETGQYASLGRKELLALTTQDFVSDIPTRIRAARMLYLSSLPQSDEQRQAIRVLLKLAEPSTVSFEYAVMAARTLHDFSPSQSEEYRQAQQALLNLAQQSDISVVQAAEVAEFLYWNSPEGSDEQKQVTHMLLHMAQRPNLSFEQALQVARIFYRIFSTEFKGRQQASQLLLGLLQRPSISVEQEIQVAQAFYLRRPASSREERQAIQILLKLEQRSDLSIKQRIQVAQALYQSSVESSRERRLGVEMLLQLAHRSDLSIEDVRQIAQVLYQTSPSNSEQERQIIQMLSHFMQRLDLFTGGTVQSTQALTQSNTGGSNIQQQMTQAFWQLAQNQYLSVEQRLQAATFLLSEMNATYAGRAQAVHIVLTLVRGEKARQYFTTSWQPMNSRSNEVNISDIPFLVELIKQELLPTEARDEMYRVLRLLISSSSI